MSLSESASIEEVNSLINLTLDSMGVASAEFVVKDDWGIHICIDASCPYCGLKYPNRSFLADHIESRTQKGNCFNS